MNITRKLSKNYKLTFVSLLSIVALLLGTVSCESCKSKSDDPTTSETSDKDKPKPKHGDKPIDLRLERLSDEVLKSGQKTCYLEISNHGTDKTESNQLQLLITREKGNVATIDGAKDLKDGTYSLEIPEAIGKGGAAINKQLTINLGTDPEAVFKLQLQYKGEIQEGVEEKVTCQAGKLEVLVHHEHFFGDQVARLELVNHSENDIESTNLSIEVVSLNKAVFQLVNIEQGDQKLGISSDQVQNVFEIKGQTIAKHSGAGIAGFTILHTNGETEAEVVIKLKKGQQEIFVSEKITWEENGVLLELEGDEQFMDNVTGKLKIFNQGNVDISTDDIEVGLVNDRGVDFKLGQKSGSKIQATLSKVLGKTAVLKSESNILELPLQCTVGLEATKQYGADLLLVLRDKNKNLLIEKKLRWINQQKITKHIVNPKLEEFSKKFRERNQAPTNSGDAQSKDKPDPIPFPWTKAVQRDTSFIPKFGERTVKTFKLRLEAEQVTLQSIAFKKQCQEFLNQEAAFIPDFVKANIKTYAIDQPDDVSIQAVDKAVQEDFEVVYQCAQEALGEAQRFAQKGDQQSLDKAIERIDAWGAVVDQFVTEIGIQEVKDLATKVKGYQTEAQKLQNP